MARPFVKLSDSFKILRDKLNTVSYNVGDPDDLLTYGDSDVVMAINEIERVFDASAGEIIYPTGNALQGETQTRLLISTAQASGTDVQINVGANFNVDAVGDINLDAGGANINFLDDSVNRIAFTLGATNTTSVTGNLILTSTGTATHEATTFTVDASGDVILDADGGNVTFKDGGVTEYNFATDGTVSRTGDLTLDISGNIILDADGANITYKDGGTTRIAYTMGATNTAAVTGNLTYDVSGNIVLDAGTNNIDLKGAGTTRFAYELGTSNTLDVTGNLTQTVSGNFSDSADGTYHIGATGNTDLVTRGDFTTNAVQATHNTDSDFVIDAGGDITLDADGAQIYFKDNNVNKFTYNFGTNQEVDVVGSLTYDVQGDIVLDADGGNIDLKDGGVARFEYGLGAANTLGITGSLAETISSGYTLDVSGNHTQTVSGNHSDSADGTYHIGATGATDIETSGTFQTKSSTQTHTVTGSYTVDASTDIILDADGANVILKDGGATRFDFQMGANQELDIPTGNFTLDVAGNIVLDADGGNIDLKDSGVARFEYGLGTTNTLDITGNLTQTVLGDYSDSASGTRDISATDGINIDTRGPMTNTAGGSFNLVTESNFGILASGTYTATSNGDAFTYVKGQTYTLKDSANSGHGFVFNLGAGTNEIDVTDSLVLDVNANITLDAGGDITLDADGGNTYLKDNGVTQFEFIAGTNKELDIASGNLTVDVAGDLTLDAAGTQINFADGVANRIVHNLGTNQEIDYTGDLTQDIGGDLTIDVDGGNVFLKDAGTQFGEFRNSGNQLDIYSGSTLAFQMTTNTIEVHNRAFFLDSALDTVAQNVAGSVNEIHTQLDSAVSEIEVTKNTIESMLRVFDSGGTSANISATGISTPNTLDKTFVGGINEIDTRLDSAVSEIESVKTTVIGVIADVNALDTRVGPLSELDSATAGGFFDSAGTAGSIVKALNELARRTVLIYDESGTLLN